MHGYFKQGVYWLPVCFVLYSLYLFFLPHTQDLSTQQLEKIGHRIFSNECGGKKSCLVAWNDGEGFASLGIGHFIWFPANKEAPFEESFPKLLQFMQVQGVALPSWLKQANPDAPWSSQQQFLAAYHSPQTQDLIQFLEQTKTIQTMFIVQRFQDALPGVLKSVESTQQNIIRDRFERIAASAQGLYALIDYVNFKGEGINPKERYQGQGWGLLQVLQHIDARIFQQQPNLAFAQAAEKVLRQRIKLSPQQRNERRWLPGWLKRVKTYSEEVL